MGIPGVTAAEYKQGKLITEWRDEQPRAVAGSHAGINGAVSAAFLPEGFPDSVSQDYPAYIKWHTIQAITSHVRGVLSSQAIFKGVGVGSQAATALGAVFSFFVRDAAGMLGAVLFAYLTGSSFDSNAKQWRLFADVVNNCGMAIDLASPLVPRAFLLMASLGSIARSVTGLAGGATNAALTQHFMRGSNAAEISAKDASRDRAITLIGMCLGMACTHATADFAIGAWALFAVLTWLHVYANIKAMRCLVLTSLNEPRLQLLLEGFLEKEKVYTPQQLSSMETLLAPPLRSALALICGQTRTRIVFGSRLLMALVDTTLEAWRAQHPSSKAQHVVQLAKNRDVLVVVNRDASPGTYVQAFTHALHLAHLRQQGSRHRLRSTADRMVLERESERWMADNYSEFVQGLLAAGWQVDEAFLPSVQWTAAW